MKITEIISQLQAKLEELGDLEVVIADEEICELVHICHIQETTSPIKTQNKSLVPLFFETEEAVVLSTGGYAG